MAEDVVATLLGCYRSKSRVPSASVGPLSRSQGFKAQARIARELGVAAGGWKVALPNGVSTAAPMFSDVILPNDARYPLAQGPIVEVELGVRLAKDLPPRAGQPYTREEGGAASGDALVGVELIGSRYEEMPPAVDPNVWLADNMGNAAYVVGDAKPLAAIGDPATLRCRYWADGELKHDVVGGHPAGDPSEWLVLWANAQDDALGGLKAGQVITTGSLIVPARFDRPTRIEAELDRIGRVTVDLV